jgi:hypothetical protein
MRASVKLSSGSAARERAALPEALPDDDATASGAAALGVEAPTATTMLCGSRPSTASTR